MCTTICATNPLFDFDGLKLFSMSLFIQDRGTSLPHSYCLDCHAMLHRRGELRDNPNNGCNTDYGIFLRKKSKEYLGGDEIPWGGERDSLEFWHLEKSTLSKTLLKMKKKSSNTCDGWCVPKASWQTPFKCLSTFEFANTLQSFTHEELGKGCTSPSMAGKFSKSV